MSDLEWKVLEPKTWFGKLWKKYVFNPYQAKYIIGRPGSGRGYSYLFPYNSKNQFKGTIVDPNEKRQVEGIEVTQQYILLQKYGKEKANKIVEELIKNYLKEVK